MRAFLLLCLSISISCLLIGCSQKEPLYNTQTYVFGTLVDITIYGESKDRARLLSNEIANRFQALHQRYHAWQPSEITALNQAFAKGDKPVKISKNTADIIRQATTLSATSNGKFNPAIGSLIKLWGFQQDEFKAKKIDTDKIKALVVTAPKMTDIIIKKDMVYSNNPAVQLDLGGYAKGYALDNALAYLQAQDVKNALINIGGNIIALGKHGDKLWHVGIQHPRQPNAIATLDLPSGWAIGTSGDYQRFFMLDGKRYCHIIDPATGYPSQGTQAVTVLIPPQKNAGTLSDVASKPIFIAEPHLRAQTAKTMQVDNYLIIESNQKIQVSSAMAKRLTWLDIKTKNRAITRQP